jgi:hypothetical protein
LTIISRLGRTRKLLPVIYLDVERSVPGSFSSSPWFW